MPAGELRRGEPLDGTAGAVGANATLKAGLGDAADQTRRTEESFIRLRPDVTPAAWTVVVADAVERLCLPAVDDEALDGLKFGSALPRHLAEATLATRMADTEGARIVLGEPHRFGSG